LCGLLSLALLAEPAEPAHRGEQDGDEGRLVEVAHQGQSVGQQLEEAGSRVEQIDEGGERSDEQGRCFQLEAHDPNMGIEAPPCL
jgi:hypothetical protein